MSAINLESYLNIVKEHFNKNNIEYNQTMASYALKRYFELPAIKEYFYNFDIVKVLGSPHPFLVLKDNEKDIKNILNVDIGLNKISKHGNKFPAFKNFLHDDNKKSLDVIIDFINKSDNFKELANHMADFNYLFLKDRISTANSNFFTLLKVHNNYLKYSDAPEFDLFRYQMLSSILDLNYKEMAGRTQYKDAIVKLSTERSTLSSNELYENICVLLNYEKININLFSIEKLSVEDRLDKIIEMSKNEYQNKTILNAVLNSDNPLESIVDNILFEKFKSSVLFELILLKKEKTLEDIYRNNPIFDEIINKFVKLEPKINLPLSDRIEHKEFIFDKDDNNIKKNNTNLSNIVYGIGISMGLQLPEVLYGKYIENNVSLSIPDKIYELKNKNFNLYYGSDGYAPYYLFIGNVDPLTMAVDSLNIKQTFIKKHLPKYVVEDALEKIYLECLQTKRPIIFENFKLENYVGEHIETFKGVAEKYKYLVPTFFLSGNNDKYKSILDTELSYDQVIIISNLYDDLHKKEDPEINIILKKKILEFEIANVKKMGIDNKNLI